MSAILELRNTIRDYRWGSTSLIHELLDVPNPDAKPQAEMWLGAHPGAPSDVRVDGEWVCLADFIARDPIGVLGREAAERFGGELPFLFKVLAAGQPLSLQAHPNEAQAQEGFRRENELGIPMDAATRNFKDDRPKPELLCAVTHFDAMLGFRQVAEIRANLERLDLAELKPVVHELDATRGSQALHDFFAGLMTSDSDWQARVARDAARMSEKFTARPAYAWLRALAADHPGDIGVLAPLFLNILTLEPGEAVYLPAGELHSYLSGCGIEIMANSDNVLRGGLTTKHVDASQLLEVLTFASGHPLILRPQPDVRGDGVYPTPAREFELTHLSPCDGRKRSDPDDLHDVSGAEIILCVEGEVVIETTDSGSGTVLRRGASVFIPASFEAYRLRGAGRAYRASIPGLGRTRAS